MSLSVNLQVTVSFRDWNKKETKPYLSLSSSVASSVELVVSKANKHLWTRGAKFHQTGAKDDAHL